jgi:hypothetical protein
MLSQIGMEQGVRVNAVVPGPVWTPLIPATMPEEKVKSFGKDTSFERAAQPVEIAPLLCFWCRAKLVTSQANLWRHRRPNAVLEGEKRGLSLRAANFSCQVSSATSHRQRKSSRFRHIDALPRKSPPHQRRSSLSDTNEHAGIGSGYEWAEVLSEFAAGPGACAGSGRRLPSQNTRATCEAYRSKTPGPLAVAADSDSRERNQERVGTSLPTHESMTLSRDAEPHCLRTCKRDRRHRLQHG